MTEEQVEQFIQAHNLKGAEAEHISAICRREGLSPGTNIHVLVVAKGITFGEAKRLMHFSEAWKSERAGWDRFHQAIEEDLKSDPTLGDRQTD